MSDLIEKIAKAMRTEFRELYGKEWSGPIKPPSFTTSDLVLASAALSAIKENAGDLVKPLEWREGLFGGYRSVCGSYEIRIILGRRNRTLRLLFSQFGSGQDMGEFVGENAEAKAKAAAQQHHTARVLSLLNLEVE